MSEAARYFQVAKMTWKSMLAYQADAWLGALVSGFRVLLSFLLWRAVFTGQSEVAGYTLQAMITYSLIAALLGRLQHQDALAWQLANEVREGQFSKYLVHPVNVTRFFVASGLGRWVYMVLVNGVAFALWTAAFAPWLAPLAPTAELWWLAALLPLGALVMLLLHHAIALLSLKFTDITGFMVAKGTVIELLSGALIPLSLLPPAFTAFLKFTPFYYVVYYPANLILGRAGEPPALAAAALAAWCVLLYAWCELWYRQARKSYEGVGI